jgi:hypothetical protein
MRFIWGVVLGASTVLLGGCYQASFNEATTFGDYNIRAYNGGVLIEQYITSGAAQSENSSDGWKFINKKTGKLTKLSGGLIIIEKR